MGQKEILDTLSIWLENQGFEIKSREYVPTLRRGFVPGPDLIAEKNGETWIIEAKRGYETTDIDCGVGQLIKRMYEYGTKNKKFFLAVNTADKVKDYIFDLGIGLIVVSEGSVVVMNATEPPRHIHGFKGKTGKKEMIRIRCTELTKRHFYSFIDQKGFKTLEDGLAYLLDKVYGVTEPEVAVDVSKPLSVG